MIGLDWLAGFLTIVTNELVTRKWRSGWIVYLVNGFLWTYLMWQAQLWGLVAMEGFLITQAAWAFWRWRKENKI